MEKLSQGLHDTHVSVFSSCGTRLGFSIEPQVYHEAKAGINSYLAQNIISSCDPHEFRTQHPDLARFSYMILNYSKEVAMYAWNSNSQLEENLADEEIGNHSLVVLPLRPARLIFGKYNTFAPLVELACEYPGNSQLCAVRIVDWDKVDGV